MGKISVRNVYIDALLSGNGRITATGLSQVLDNQHSHDQITRMLHSQRWDGASLFRHAKQLIKGRKACGPKMLIVDDSVLPKPYSSLNGVVAYHYDHTQGKAIRGMSLMTLLYSDDEIAVPLVIELVEKEVVGEEGGKKIWKNPTTKNQLYRLLLPKVGRCPSLAVDYVLNDAWYSCTENMQCVLGELGTNFIMAIKANRYVATSLKAARQGRWQPLEQIKLGKRAVKLYLKGLDTPVLVVKEVLKNGDGSSGALYLATSDLQLDRPQILDLYKRRWKIEEYHRSLKQNCALGGSQTYHKIAQKAHILLCAFAFIRLEKAKCALDKNHYELLREVNRITTKRALSYIKTNLHFNLNNYQIAA